MQPTVLLIFLRDISEMEVLVVAYLQTTRSNEGKVKKMRKKMVGE